MATLAMHGETLRHGSKHSRIGLGAAKGGGAARTIQTRHHYEPMQVPGKCHNSRLAASRAATYNGVSANLCRCQRARATHTGGPHRAQRIVHALNARRPRALRRQTRAPNKAPPTHTLAYDTGTRPCSPQLTAPPSEGIGGHAPPLPQTRPLREPAPGPACAAHPHNIPRCQRQQPPPPACMQYRRPRSRCRRRA